MKLNAHPDAITGLLQAWYPEAEASIATALSTRSFGYNAISQYQAYILYAWTLPYNIEGAMILEIGTLLGFSAAVMAEAAPLAKITTLNPVGREMTEARHNLRAYTNVTVKKAKSWEYLAQDTGWYDVVFIDGDHNRIALDLPWWDRIKANGLMAFHDYSPGNSPRPCQPVFDAVNMMARDMALKEPDTFVIDSDGVGMAGFYRGGI